MHPVDRNENCFRTVAFGGFHKQDVLNYITASSRDNQEKNEQWKKKAQSAQQELEVLEQKYASTEDARKAAAEKCEQLSNTLTLRTNSLEQAERELAVLKAEHEKASARLAELEERLPRLESDAQAYAELKDHTATIEMEAHRKAQEILEQAQSQAAGIRSELGGWLRRVQTTYQHLRADVSATMTHLLGELERGKQALEETAPAFNQHDQVLAELLECEKTMGPKAPEPLPLEDSQNG